MNKRELTKIVASQSGVKIDQAKKILNATLETITEELQRDGSVVILGFGSFRVNQRNARNGYNPLSRTAIKIKETKAVKFKLSSKVALNDKK
jgi:DNA-binding protein HU-beta